MTLQYFSRLRLWTLAFTALVPVGFGQERVAQDPHDNSGLVDQALISTTSNVTGGVTSVTTDAAAACPQACMIKVPNTALTTGDANTSRSWTCVWPVQAVGETQNCPTGWTGTYSQDRDFEVRDCGNTMYDTGRTTMLSVNCTRIRKENKVEPCPDASGGHWTGGGVTWYRNHSEKLEMDLTTITETSVTDWAVESVDCKRTVAQTTYQFCPDGTAGSCLIETIGSDVVTNSCPSSIPSNNTSTMTVNQYLGTNLLGVYVESSTASTTTGEQCPTDPYGCPYTPGMPSGFCVPPGEGVGSLGGTSSSDGDSGDSGDGDSDGDGDGDGEGEGEG